MAVAMDDILRFTAKGVYLGQQCQNVFFYQANFGGVNSPYATWLQGFRESVIDKVRVVQSTSYAWTETDVENLTNGLDFATEVYNPQILGAKSGDPTPSFEAANIQLKRSTKLTRHGSKRFSGLIEPDVSGNTVLWTVSETDSVLDACRLHLFAVVLMVPVDHGTPVIVGRNLVSPGPPPRYELDLTKINVISDAELTAVSTQRSRKLGHGI